MSATGLETNFHDVFRLIATQRAENGTKLNYLPNRKLRRTSRASFYTQYRNHHLAEGMLGTPGAPRIGIAP
jgi:hypothetical protein